MNTSKSSKENLARIKMRIGTVIFVLGLISPVFIPFIQNAGFNPSIKNVLSGLLAIGGPEIMMILAGVIMGKENLQILKSRIGSFFKPLAPPDFVSKTRFYIGISLFILCLLETLVHLHWDGIIYLYEDFKIAYYLFWNFLFLLSLYILGGDFFDRLIGLFVYKSSEAIE